MRKTDIRKAAAAMGRVKSERKTAAVRENGKLGGRPVLYGSFKDLTARAKSGDITPLIIHWEGDESEPETGTAADLIEIIRKLAIDRRRDHEHESMRDAVKFLDSIAYVMTESEYLESKKE